MKQVIIILIAILAFSCNQGKVKIDNGSNSHEIIVEEVIQSSGYTYIRFTMNDSLQWLATSLIDAKVGEKYYFEESMKMLNFHSKELNRSFETILFVEDLTTEPISAEDITKSSLGSGKAKIERVTVTIEKSKDELTVADLYLNKESYANKVVIIKGIVVKFSPLIMNKNWVHIQDGTESDGKYDLTVTTLAEFKVGDTITLEGKVALNKDFGHGYKYDLLLEDAVVK
ncbi:MAG: hypothetical protein AB9846_01715 [Tenuifilaceae bacterium]